MKKIIYDLSSLTTPKSKENFVNILGNFQRGRKYHSVGRKEWQAAAEVPVDTRRLKDLEGL